MLQTPFFLRRCPGPLPRRGLAFSAIFYKGYLLHLSNL